MEWGGIHLIWVLRAGNRTGQGKVDVGGWDKGMLMWEVWVKEGVFVYRGGDLKSGARVGTGVSTVFLKGTRGSHSNLRQNIKSSLHPG